MAVETATRMNVDPNVWRDVNQYGFAQVIIVLEQSGIGTAERPEVVEKVTSVFLDPLSLPVWTVPSAIGLGESSLPAVAPPEVTYLPRLGIAAGYVNRQGLEQIATAMEVRHVEHADLISLIRPVESAPATGGTGLTWGLNHLQVDKLWERGLTGQGIRIGHLDSGVDASHPALQGRVASFAKFDFFGDRLDNASPHDSSPISHGTHTAATICGGEVDGWSIGVAPNARICSGMVIEGGQATLRVLQGMEWLLGENIRILNMSLGFRGYTPFFLDVTRRVREHNVFPVFAIGNEGPGTSRSPGNYAESLSVGASTEEGGVWEHSSSIVFDRSYRPQQPLVVAPGTNVISAKAGAGLVSMSGTSMATPHVSGVIALLMEAVEGATIDQIEESILSTSKQLPGVPALRQGYGLIDPLSALEALLQ